MSKVVTDELTKRITALEKKVAELDRRTVGSIRVGPSRSSPSPYDLGNVEDIIKRMKLKKGS